MEERDVKINNELIAKFMGGKYYPNGIYSEWRFADGTTPSNLQYHTDWNWLMGVVDKIESLPEVDYTKTYSEYDNLYEFEIFLMLNPNTEPDFSIQSDKKLASVYLTVVKFIKWYNEQK